MSVTSLESESSASTSSAITAAKISIYKIHEKSSTFVRCVIIYKLYGKFT